jgi:hypothetical protein
MTAVQCTQLNWDVSIIHLFASGTATGTSSPCHNRSRSHHRPRSSGVIDSIPIDCLLFFQETIGMMQAWVAHFVTHLKRRYDMFD